MRNDGEEREDWQLQLMVGCHILSTWGLKGTRIQITEAAAIGENGDPFPKIGLTFLATMNPLSLFL